MSKAQIDPFAEMERLIEESFQRDTAAARQKRDAGMEHVRALRAGWSANFASSAEEANAPDATPGTPAPDVVNGVTLKAAMVEAIQSLDGPISRGKVLAWVVTRYPALKASKEGTVASTFSRVKSVHLKPAVGDKFLFHRKEPELVDQTS
ncbi:MAG: hypothetical protein JWL69_4148 [Phycisphaerales bacterium]|nr:hypothetical protein [Phycisphaerales bacterium]